MTINPLGVRRATPEDAAALYAFVLPLKTEAALQPVSEIKIRALVDRCVNMDGGFAGVIDGPRGIEASIGLVLAEFDYSEARHLRAGGADGWFGVALDFRSVNHGKRLMQFANWCSGSAGVPVFVEVATLEALAQKVRLAQRHARQVGASFVCGAPPPGAFNQHERSFGNTHRHPVTGARDMAAARHG